MKEPDLSALDQSVYGRDPATGFIYCGLPHERIYLVGHCAVCGIPNYYRTPVARTNCGHADCRPGGARWEAAHAAL